MVSDEHNGEEGNKGPVGAAMVMLVLLLCAGALGAPCPLFLTLKGTLYMAHNKEWPLHQRACQEMGARGRGQGCMYMAHGELYCISNMADQNDTCCVHVRENLIGVNSLRNFRKNCHINSMTFFCQVTKAQPRDIYTAVLETDVSETPIVIEVKGAPVVPSNAGEHFPGPPRC